MWTPKTIESRHGDLYFDGKRFSNGAKKVGNGSETVRDDIFQMIVCPSCRNVGCASGNCVMVRRAADIVVLLPAFELISNDGYPTYDPPSYMEDDGAVIFARDEYERDRKRIGPLPAFEDLKPLMSREAALQFQWEAPHGVLGSFPNHILFDRQALLTTDADAERDNEIVGAVETIALGLMQEPQEVSLVSEGRREPLPIILDFDVFDVREWKPICRGGQLMLRFEPGYVVEPQA